MRRSILSQIERPLRDRGVPSVATCGAPRRARPRMTESGHSRAPSHAKRPEVGVPISPERTIATGTRICTGMHVRVYTYVCALLNVCVCVCACARLAQGSRKQIVGKSGSAGRMCIILYACGYVYACVRLNACARLAQGSRKQILRMSAVLRDSGHCARDLAQGDSHKQLAQATRARDCASTLRKQARASTRLFDFFYKT